MYRVLSGSSMKEVDNYTINEIGISSLVLMERAALEVYNVVSEYADFTRSNIRILVVCGVGNNGADGLAFARILQINKGISPDIFIIGNEDKATEEFSVQKNITIDKMGCQRIYNIDEIRQYDIIVDAVFGIGLKRDIAGTFAEVICNINAAGSENGAMVISVDIPSGINADNGRIMGCAVNAGVTVTFGAMKRGIALYPGAEYAGKVLVKNIGFPTEALERLPDKGFSYEYSDLCSLPVRRIDANKGTFGKILIAAGSTGMCGAAYLSAKAAFRSGAGLVRIYTADENRVALAKIIPEAIIETYSSDFDTDSYIKLLEWADVIVVGPGIGIGSAKDSIQSILTEYALKSGKPVIIDADALNTISADSGLAMLYHDKCIVTPHPGEMSRLTGIPINEIKLNISDVSSDYAAEHGVTCVLKDARTVVSSADRRCYYNMSGNNGMATAGSGDVLTGIIAAMAASGMDIFSAASMGVFLHGLAGDDAADRLGTRGVMASDIIDGVVNVLKKL